MRSRIRRPCCVGDDNTVAAGGKEDVGQTRRWLTRKYEAARPGKFPD